MLVNQSVLDNVEESSGKSPIVRGSSRHAKQGLDLGTIAQLLVVLAAVPTVVFPIGMIVLWIQIEHTFTHDFGAAWYAATLPSKTSILGFGAGAIFRGVIQDPTNAILFVICLAGIPIFARQVYSYDVNELNSENQSLESLKDKIRNHPNPIIIGPYVYIGPKAYLVILMILTCLTIVSWAGQLIIGEYRLVVSHVIMAGGMLGAVSLMAYDYRLALAGLKSRHLWFVRSFIAALCTIAMVATLLAVVRQPPLPLVEVTNANEAPVSGTLLVHTNAYWYIFDEFGTLLAIPDTNITIVRVSD